jgi:uncharacterized membrane protein (UPF0127 family)
MNTTVTNSMFMLFSFGEPGNHPFWMKDTYSPLDIIWLRSNGTQATIVAVASVPPCVSYSADQGSCITYTPLEPADYVIETREGFVVRNRLAPGSQIMLLRWSADSRPIIGSARSSASC